jgi:hypothetical protein
MPWKDFTSTTLGQADVDTYLMAQANIVVNTVADITTPTVGMIAYESSTKLAKRCISTGPAVWEIWGGGGAWQTYTPTFSAWNGTTFVSNTTVVNGTIAGRYRFLAGRAVLAQVSYAIGSSDSGYTVGGAGYNWTFSLPVTKNNLVSFGQGEFYDTSANVSYPIVGLAFGGSAGHVLIGVHVASGTYLSRTPFNGAAAVAAPVAIASGDSLSLAVLYETTS